MGADPFNYDQAVSAEGLMELYRCHSNVQHFQRNALRWALYHGGQYEAAPDSVAEVAEDLSAPKPTLRERFGFGSASGQNGDSGDSPAPAE